MFRHSILARTRYFNGKQGSSAHNLPKATVRRAGDPGKKYADRRVYLKHRLPKLTRQCTEITVFSWIELVASSSKAYEIINQVLATTQIIDGKVAYVDFPHIAERKRGSDPNIKGHISQTADSAAAGSSSREQHNQGIGGIQQIEGPGTHNECVFEIENKAQSSDLICLSSKRNENEPVFPVQIRNKDQAAFSNCVRKLVNTAKDDKVFLC